MKLAQKILDIFENYLSEKGVTITNPERDNDENAALIYGTEYSDLECAINNTINGETCYINTSVGRADGTLNVIDGDICVKSDSLDTYLEDYSME